QSSLGQGLPSKSSIYISLTKYIRPLNIELHYLPPYSPNLNPIERLWKVMNEKSRNNVYFKTKRDFKAAIDQIFSVTLPEIAGSLTSRINDNFQVLKPASSS
uniref:transposase n=1 Tax=uncultured Vibrio sp. TaxID=114054 RepID=UPI0026162007